MMFALNGTVKIKALPDDMKKIVINDKIEDLTISIRAQKKIKVPDAIIAATAVDSSAILVTRNTKDFKGIGNLKVLDPFNAE